MSIWNWLMNPSGLTPHGFCLSWAPGLIATHVIADAVIGLAYFSIPLAIASFIRRRPDIQYGWVAYLFVGFILACGTTHLWAILTLWVPAYGVEAVIKVITAGLSLATAAILWPLIPKAAALPSAAQLERLNDDLERRVAERTAQLEATNAQLSDALNAQALSQKALAISEEQFRASFEAAAVGKVQVDPVTKRITRANKALATMLGYEVDDMIGLGSEELNHPEGREDEDAKYAALLDGDIPAYITEKRYVRRDGESIWVRVSATQVRLPESGAPFMTVAVIENIDEQYKARIALQAAKQDLEVMLDERTRTLTQRDLLLREVYHRVKNNLQIVDSMLVMQRRLLSDPDARAALNSLRDRIYALGLVHHQLMGSHDLETFDVAPFLRELSENVVQSGVSRDIDLLVRAEPLAVGLDFAIPLGLIVTELVTNAMKHAFPEGAGRIEVLLRRIDDGRVELIVADDGAGYDSEAASNGDARPSLGFTIIEGLVKQLGATMTVTREHGVRCEILVPGPVSK
jgi:PAS domain S-box-containing protein